MTWRIAWDLDGTCSADPDLFRFLSHAIRESGGEVFIVTGTHEDKASPETIDAKKQLLRELDIEYDVLQVTPVPIAENKRKYCKDAKIDWLVDNRPMNVSAVFGVCAAALFVPEDDESDPSPNPL